MSQEDPTLRNLDIIARHASRNPGDSPSSKKPPSRIPKWLRALGPVGIALIFLGGKLKFLLPAFKFLKMGTLLSMVLAVWLYAMIWGLPFALGFVLLILVHEMGHALAMRRMGIAAGAPVFIPFVGAVIAMKEMPRDAYVEAVVAIGGPLIGTLGALVCLGVALLTGSLFWYALASTGFLINLFNMIPISPLDGGRIVGVISRWLWVVGYAVGIGVFLATKSPILFLILLLGLFSLGRVIRGPHPEYYQVPPTKRLRIGAAYFGLLAFLAILMWVSDQPLRGLTS
jgi:Zn-dependent protease